MALEQGRGSPDHEQGKGREMENRIGALERDINVLSHNQKVLSESFHSLEREMKEGISSLRDGIGVALSKMDQHIVAEQARKPMPYRDMVSMATSMGTLIIMLSGAIFFLIEARVSAAVTESSAFVREWKQDGRLYVTLSKLQDDIIHMTQRIAELEKQAQGRPQTPVQAPK
jgi:hypothetical protein